MCRIVLNGNGTLAIMILKSERANLLKGKDAKLRA